MPTCKFLQWYAPPMTAQKRWNILLLIFCTKYASMPQFKLLVWIVLIWQMTSEPFVWVEPVRAVRLD